MTEVWSEADIYKLSYEHNMRCIDAFIAGTAEIIRDEDGKAVKVQWPSPESPDCFDSIDWSEE